MERWKLALSAAVIPISLTAPAIAQRIEQPSWKAGDTWTLQTTISTPVGSSTSEVVRIVQEVNPDSYVLWTRSSPTNSESLTPSAMRVDQDPDSDLDDTHDQNLEMRFLRWPLEPGGQFAFGAGKKEREWSGKVEGWVEISTPAGTFKALKITLTRSGVGRGSAFELLWYAPEVKYVVRRESVRPWTLMKKANATTTTEVVAYKLN